MWGPEQAREHHHRCVSQLSETQRAAYEYICSCRRGVMADDLANDQDINPFTAGVVMHDLAELGLVKYEEKGLTISGRPARRYIACYPTEVPPPLPSAVKQSLEEKWFALEQAAVLIHFVLEKHPEWERFLKVGDGYEPEFAELLTLLANVRRSVKAAQRNRGEDQRD